MRQPTFPSRVALPQKPPPDRPNKQAATNRSVHLGDFDDRPPLLTSQQPRQLDHHHPLLTLTLHTSFRG
ncbi:hypothetical protein ASPBRDRAFT_604419 [Aspergillus brasiliensis CBS 101740]|uniref:Uncharacterized protein n=1 Tax=Aspergillus brasiliensis (strain CBS 101740 / IMI 381727 / IBT 21946) TaxID=767769 RepID=A0A1L9UHN3_ASPBC|nr:hypothetical protein ASPBRDRAFT_604419 [Aspergillus brasiliensis CBS 101740]